MKKQLMLTAAAIAFTATMATADTIDNIVAALTAEGYERIHIRPGTDAIRVAAIKDGVRLDVAYDADTGAVLSERSRAARADDDEGNGRLRAAADDGERRPPRGPRPQNADDEGRDDDHRGPPPRGPRPEGAESDGDDDGRRGPPPRGPRPEGADGDDENGERRGPPPRGPRPEGGDDDGRRGPPPPRGDQAPAGE